MSFLNKVNNKYLSTNKLNILLIFSICFGIGALNTISTIYILIIQSKIILNKEYKLYKQKWFILSIVLYLIIIFSGFTSSYSNEIFVKSLTNLRFPLMALSIQYTLIKKDNLIFMLKCIFFIVVFVTIDSIIQYFFGINLFGNNISETAVNRSRLTSIFGDEEIVGAFLIKFFLLGFIYFVNKNFSIKLNFFVFVVFGITIFLSQERMAFLLFCLSIFIILIFFTNKERIISVLVSLITIITIFYGIVSFDETLKRRYVQTFTHAGSGINIFVKDKENSHSNYKFEIVRGLKNSLWGAHFLTAIEIFKDNPILGTGPKTFRYECKKNKYDNIDSLYKNKRCSTHPHNYYLEILSENGIIGLGYLLILLIIFFYNEIKLFVYRKNFVQGFLVLSIFVNLWPIASTGSFYSSLNGLAIWLSIGVLFGYKKILSQ